MKFLKHKDLLQKFGNPSRPGFYETYVTHILPPFDMYFGKAQVSHIAINKLVAEDLKNILREIWEASGKSQAKIHEWGADQFSGTFVVRPVRNGKNLSDHSFALAIDLDAAHNKLGTKGRFTKNHPVVKIFEKHGWFHGRKWKRLDPMHFSAVDYS